jgi:hypothetical protein
MVHNGAMPRRRPTHRPLSLSGTHWRQDGQAKVRFGSQSEALSAADQRRLEAGVALGVYTCDFCGGWHLTRRARGSD